MSYRRKMSMTTALVALLAITGISGCSVRQKGDAGMSESRIRESGMASPNNTRHSFNDDRRYLKHFP